MLEMLRRGATKLMVFVLFAILILSFAIWGIGDMVRTGGQGPLAEVGSTNISPQEYTSALQHRRQLLTRQLGQPLTPEQSRAFGIDAAVLSELINGAAVSNHAKSLGLRLSDQAIAELIRADPAFQGPDQTFSRALFDERIRQFGFSEQRYFNERRSNEVREQLTEAITASVHASDSLINILHRYREELRAIAYVRLDPEKVAKPGDPDDKALRGTYDEQKQAFTMPERRKIAVLVVTPDQLRERAKVTDEEVHASWEQSRPAWDIPERRRVQQIQFKTKAEAEGEAKAIDEGKSFLLAALEANARAPLDLGLVARREMPDTLAKVAFDLPLNKLSEPVQIRGGYTILRVTAIEPARARSFDEVKQEVRQSIEDTKLREIAGKLHDEIEDKRGATDAAEKLKAIATELKLTLIEATGVDAKGNGPDGKPAITHPDADKFIASAMEGDKTTPREVISLADGGEAWVEVVEITPAVTKPFEEVKGEVEKLWRARELRAALGKQAQALVDRVKSGEPLDSIAKELGTVVETTALFKRTQPAPGVSPAGARQAFTLAKGGVNSAQTPDDKTRMVFVVTEIKPPEAPTKEQADALKAELKQELQNDTLQTYVTALRERQGVKINETIYKRTVGLENPQ